jgi:hypothetical protein
MMLFNKSNIIVNKLDIANKVKLFNFFSIRKDKGY